MLGPETEGNLIFLFFEPYRKEIVEVHYLPPFRLDEEVVRS